MLGLNVFTACYGPAPAPDYFAGPDETEQNDGTKAEVEEEEVAEEEDELAQP